MRSSGITSVSYKPGITIFTFPWTYGIADRTEVDLDVLGRASDMGVEFEDILEATIKFVLDERLPDDLEYLLCELSVEPMERNMKEFVSHAVCNWYSYLFSGLSHFINWCSIHGVNPATIVAVDILKRDPNIGVLDLVRLHVPKSGNQVTRW